jgi:hypothetical protein
MTWPRTSIKIDVPLLTLFEVEKLWDRILTFVSLKFTKIPRFDYQNC